MGFEPILGGFDTYHPNHAALAHLGERSTCNAEVAGSSPACGSERSVNRGHRDPHLEARLGVLAHL